jgi:putative Mn2+ efflux pump MntP
MTTYELFLCWIIVMLLVMVVGEVSIIKLGDYPNIYGGAIICLLRAPRVAAIIQRYDV